MTLTCGECLTRWQKLYNIPIWIQQIRREYLGFELATYEYDLAVRSHTNRLSLLLILVMDKNGRRRRSPPIWAREWWLWIVLHAPHHQWALLEKRIVLLESVLLFSYEDHYSYQMGLLWCYFVNLSKSDKGNIYGNRVLKYVLNVMILSGED